MALGQRLRIAREALGLTLQAVSEKTGIGVSSLSEYEADKREPRVAQLHRLAEVYSRPISYLLDDNPEPARVVLWRERPESPDAEQLTAQFLRLCEQYRNLEQWTGEERHCALPGPAAPRSYFSYNDAEALAAKVRTELGLGSRPGTGLLRVLEEVCAVKVFHLEFQPTGVAACTLTPEFGAAILLNRNNPSSRRSFDLAHELFHLLTWRHFRTGDARAATSEQEEKLATCFARNLLMPRDALQSAIGARITGSTLGCEDIFALAREFEVSCEALIWQIAIVYERSDEVSRRLIAKCLQMARHREGPREVPPLRPIRFEALAVRALRHGEMSLGRFAEYMGINRHQAEGYLNEQEDAQDEEIAFALA